MEVPQNGCFIRETPIKMDDLEVPQVQETSIYGQPVSVSIDWINLNSI